MDARVKPYGIHKNDDLAALADSDVTLVGKSADWPPGSDAPFLDRPRHYGDCKTGFVERSGASGAIEMDCDLGHGASGGSLLSRGADPILLGINKNGTETRRQECDPSIGAGGHDSYHEYCWMNQATPVAGDFQREILKAAGEVLDNTPATPLGG